MQTCDSRGKVYVAMCMLFYIKSDTNNITTNSST